MVTMTTRRHRYHVVPATDVPGWLGRCDTCGFRRSVPASHFTEAEARTQLDRTHRSHIRVSRVLQGGF